MYSESVSHGGLDQLAHVGAPPLSFLQVAGGVVVAEYTRSSIADSRKEEKRRQEREALRQKDLELERELQMLKARLDALESTASDSWLPRILRGSTILGGGNRSTTSPAENSSGSGTSEVETTESHEEEDEHVPEETGDEEKSHSKDGSRKM
ncbi:unnamed protein product [Closterium sp. NIES-54]